jgi:tetratricopeptide (TPR) repeat protein
MIKLEECPICKKTDFESLDSLRDHKYWYLKDMRDETEPVGFKICKNCAFVTYDYVEPDRLESHYDRERPVMSFNNIITGNRKNEYHREFLRDITLITDWKYLDVGCANGSFLDFLAREYSIPRKNLYGTEHSKAFGNFAKYEYGLNISRHVENIKYNFISYYHVLEHIQWPDIALTTSRELLTDDGYLYISVPVFFEDFEEASGSILADFENLYHLNHVNVFTKKSLKNLLSVCGFDIIKENDTYYAYTVLCKKRFAHPLDNTEKQDYQYFIDELKKQKQAVDLVNQKKNLEAISLIPNYPDAYLMQSLNAENMKSFDGQVKILTDGLTKMPKNHKLLVKLAQVYLQWDENKPDKKFYSNNIKMAEKLFLEALELRPNEDIYYFLALIEFKYKNNNEKAVRYLKKNMEINPTKFNEAWNMISAIYKVM